jgi:probable phosphoglycerate mutase
LTPEGIRQASAWGRQLSDFSVGRMLSSDLGRAVNTAQLINRTLHVPVDRDSRLREQDWGDWTGMTMSQIKRLHPGVLENERKEPWAFQPAGGEDRLSMVARAYRCLEDAAGRWPSQRILVVCHEGVIKGLIYFLASGTRVSTIRSYHLHVLSGSPDRLRIVAVNRMGMEIDR